MNQRQIDRLDGRELDLAIAKYVFGQEQPEDTTWYEKRDDGTWIGDIPDVCIDEDGSECYARSWSVVEWPPRYHESDYLAFQVVDKILDFLGNGAEFTLKQCEGFMDAQFLYCMGYLGFDSWAVSRPLAICRAALKVVCNETQKY